MSWALVFGLHNSPTGGGPPNNSFVPIRWGRCRRRVACKPVGQVDAQRWSSGGSGFASRRLKAAPWPHYGGQLIKPGQELIAAKRAERTSHRRCPYPPLFASFCATPDVGHRIFSQGAPTMAIATLSLLGNGRRRGQLRRSAWRLPLAVPLATATKPTGRDETESSPDGLFVPAAT